MKIAIIDHNHKSMKATQFFLDLGAHVVLFNNKFTHDDFKNTDLLQIKSNKVIRIHRCFLEEDEIPSNGKSRMVDLYRVVYKVEPTAEAMANLPSEILESLQADFESYTEVDFVINFQKPLPKKLGVGGFDVIGEKFLDNKHISYDRDSFEYRNINKNNIALVGKPKYLVDYLTQNHEQIFTSQCDFFLITSAPQFYKDLDDDQKIKMESILKKNLSLFENQAKEYDEKLLNWENLELHIKAKTSKPILPKPYIQTFSGFTVSSVDRLVDREGVFLTIEKPSFREGGETTRTLAIDHILVFNGHFGIEDLGYFYINEFTSLDELKREMLKYFSIENYDS